MRPQCAGEYTDESSLSNLAKRTKAGHARKEDILRYHTPQKMSDAIIAIERLYNIGDVDAQRRNAQDCADGALIGLLTRDMVVKVLNAKQGLSDDIVHGRLDAWHAIVKVLEHSDRLEEDPSSGLVTRYYKLTRQLRRVSAYGQGQKTFKAVASEHKEKWKRPVAPQVDGTRTKLYETVRVPPIFSTTTAPRFWACVFSLTCTLARERQKKQRNFGRSERR